ncbi:MAG: hypothetical protein OEV92_10870, partial [Nitrospinota bacterium]|nr:hypothetical protein [Nitrospinota bacterium]
GVHLEQSTGLTMLDHAAMLFADWPYHLWVMEGLFHPLPLWLGVPAFIYAAYRRWWGLMFLWAGVLTAFLIGKIAKPNAAGWHLLNVSPFFLLMAAVGIIDAVNHIKMKPARDSMMALLCGLLLLAAVQDASFWRIPPVKATVDDWIAENIGDEESVNVFPEFYPEKGETRQWILREIQSGYPGRGYSTLRELYWYVTLREGAPIYYPLSHLASKKPVAQIFPQSPDLVTTDRAFATGPDTGLASARRYILSDQASGQICVLASNAHSQPNTLRLRIGGQSRTFTLQRGASAVFTFNRDQNRSFLMKGAYVEIEASSSLDAVWMVGATSQQIGDIYSQLGQVSKAVESYAESATAYSLLRIMALSERGDVRLRAFAELGRLYPKLYMAITNTPLEELTWPQIAGFSDSAFSAKTEKTLTLDMFNRGGGGGAGATINPGDSLYGPYLALTQGEYRLKVRWMTGRRSPVIFRVDIRTSRGDDQKISRAFTADEVTAGHAEIPFTVTRVTDYPLEIRIGDVQGGAVMIESMFLSIDYLAHARKIIQAGLDGLKKKKI